MSTPERTIETEEQQREVLARIAALLEERRFIELRKKLARRTPPDLAEIVRLLPREQEGVVFRLLPRELAAHTFEYLPLEEQEELLKAMGDRQVAELLEEMSPDDRTALLEELPAIVTRKLLNLLSPEERTLASKLLGYPEDSIGRLMTPDYVAVRPDWTVEEVLAHIRKYGRDSETLNVVYVVDPGGVLIDDIRIRELLLVDPATRLADVTDRQFVSLQATDDQEKAVAIFRKLDRSALPVTDTGGVLVGIVTVDDVLDVAEEEATEDIQKLGGTEALEEPYLSIALPRMIRKRASWLVLLLIGEMLTATAMGFFESEIASAVVLALFIPLIISSGGNSGSQAATLVTRALALGEVTVRDWWRVMHREILSGLGLGLILGVVGFARVTIWAVAFHRYGPHWLPIAFTIGISLVGVVLWGSLAGSMLPIALKRFGADPAASSAPFVATLVDVTGIVIYFTVAATVLRELFFERTAMQQPTLETARLILRPFELEDAGAVQALVEDRRIAATTLSIPHPYPPGAAEEWIASQPAKLERLEVENFAIVRKETGELVGSIGLVLALEHGRAEMGYWIGAPFWGHGYATEAARALLAHGFVGLGLHRIHASWFGNNPASGKVMEKIGMRPEGTLRAHVVKWGRPLDVHCWAILREEWSV